MTSYSSVGNISLPGCSIIKVFNIIAYFLKWIRMEAQVPFFRRHYRLCHQLDSAAGGTVHSLSKGHLQYPFPAPLAQFESLPALQQDQKFLLIYAASTLLCFFCNTLRIKYTKHPPMSVGSLGLAIPTPGLATTSNLQKQLTRSEKLNGIASARKPQKLRVSTESDFVAKTYLACDPFGEKSKEFAW